MPLPPAEVFEALATCYVELVRAMLGPSPATSGRDPDCAWGRTPVPITDMNRVMAPRLPELPGPLEMRVDELEDRFTGHPHSWWLDPGSRPAELEDTLRWLAPRPLLELVPAMAIDLAELPAEQVPGIDVAFAAGSVELVAAGHLAARGFGLELDEATGFDSLFERVGRDAASPVRVAVGRLDGEPAATALGCLAGDILGVYNVATVPGVRRRGLGRAVTLAVLRDGAARGAKLAVLEASEAGRPVYHRLGFVEAGRFRVLSVLPPERGVTG